MATLQGKTVSVDFSSLSSTAIAAVVFLSVGTILEYVLKRLKRGYPKNSKRNRGIEGWAMGYLYRAREYVPNPTKVPESWIPLAWVLSSWKLTENDILKSCGGDAAAYVRLLRGLFYWTLFLTFTLFPILFSINFSFSGSIPRSSIERGSISGLISTERGRNLLGIHLAAVYLLSSSFYITLFWIGKGIVANRRESVKLITGQEEEVGVTDENRGWRFRTILIRNLPPFLREEEALRTFFSTRLSSESSEKEIGITSPIVDIILVKKISNLNSLFQQFIKTQGELEAAHTTLAINVMNYVKQRTNGLPSTSWTSKFTHSKVEHDLEENLDPIEEDLLKKMKKFIPMFEDADETEDEKGAIWIALSALPPHYLDQFQPLVKLKHFQKKTPAIQYLSQKLIDLRDQIEELRSAPNLFQPSSTAFITFSNLKDASAAMKLGKGGIFKRSKDKGESLMRIEQAPDIRDLDWGKLPFSSLSADIIRGILFQSLIWIATLIYLLPISAALSIISITSISKFAPAVADYLNARSLLKSVVSNLIPTLVVALLAMLIPTLIGILSRNGEIFYSNSSLQSAIMARYWKWSIINVIIIFSIGLSAFSSAISLFNTPPNQFFDSLLLIIASSFPKGATFFISWSILVTGSQNGLCLALVGIPYINHASIRKQRAPRQRASEEGAWSRSYLTYMWIPQHLLSISVIFTFSTLNPLILPFICFYFLVTLTVSKYQHNTVYWRRWYELSGRIIFRRAFRYSLDSLLLGLIIILAFFEISKEYLFGALIIPILFFTLFIKLIGTRWFDKLMNQLDDLEADLICGGGDDLEEKSLIILEKNEGSINFSTISRFTASTLPSLLLRPNEELPPRNIKSLSSDQQQSIEMKMRSRSNTRLTNRMVSILKEEVKVQEENKLVILRAVPSRDDRPQYHHKYDAPSLVHPLENSLWLPVNPLLPIDLADCLDWSGGPISSSSTGPQELEIIDSTTNLVNNDKPIISVLEISKNYPSPPGLIQRTSSRFSARLLRVEDTAGVGTIEEELEIEKREQKNSESKIRKREEREESPIGMSWFRNSVLNYGLSETKDD